MKLFTQQITKYCKIILLTMSLCAATSTSAITPTIIGQICGSAANSLLTQCRPIIAPASQPILNYMKFSIGSAVAIVAAKLIEKSIDNMKSHLIKRMFWQLY
ncbi:hypothetical protein HOL34_01555 [bacterium]|jgi:hypothetical protein|nr:hypothetical protein [bacterium]MBT3903595.1 hypothetical protein [bacterium]MBT4577869.1 hypothetical protein [bacterium]MBT5345952.1 hypothetical protein [bacterium]MBT6130738.1 hypothetical protein [bacterium]